MLNINLGNNEALLNVCKSLKDNVPIPEIAKYCKESEVTIRELISKINKE